MSEISKGYVGWGIPQPGFPGYGYISPATVPVVKQPTYVKLALICHGESDHHAFSHPFIVPAHIRVNFFYDPHAEDSTLCYSTSDLPKICALTPKLVYPPGSSCPNLKLSRVDDIGVPTGFYSCESGGTLPVISLGPAQVYTPPLEYITSYLDTVINDLEREQSESGEIYDVYVLACGVTVRYKLHPSRMTAILLRDGTTLRQNLLEQAQAVATAEQQKSGLSVATAEQQKSGLSVAQTEEILWKEIRRLQKGGKRKKRSTRRKRKSRGRSRRHR